MLKILPAQINEMTVRQEGERVILIYNGRLVCELTWQAADEVARALTVQARKAEEVAKAEQVIMDQAILTRLGAPFGLTNHPVLQREAAKEAAWNVRLRRYLPGGIRSKEVFGTPTIIRHKPRRRNDGEET